MQWLFLNRPFPSSLVPLFQSESKCETILMKMTLICTHFETEAQENSEVALIMSTAD